MALLVITGKIGDRLVEVRWRDGDLTGDLGAMIRARVVASRREEVGLAGLGTAPATLDAGARLVTVAATIAEGLDVLARIDGLEPEPIPPGAIA